MSVDALLEVIRHRNLRLANLFQLDDERWQANVSDGEKYWDFGKGGTAEEALRAALHVAATTTPEPSIQRRSEVLTVQTTPRRFTKTVSGRIVPAQDVDISDLEI